MDETVYPMRWNLPCPRLRFLSVSLQIGDQRGCLVIRFTEYVTDLSLTLHPSLHSSVCSCMENSSIVACSGHDGRLTAGKSNYLNKASLAVGKGGRKPDSKFKPVNCWSSRLQESRSRGRGPSKTFNSDYISLLIAFGNMLTYAAHIVADNHGP